MKPTNNENTEKALKKKSHTNFSLNKTKNVILNVILNFYKEKK